MRRSEVSTPIFAGCARFEAGNRLDSRFKRRMDFWGALSALVLLSPVFLLVYCLVFSFMGRPVYFSQIRAGRRGRPFRLYKFRTMEDTRDDQGRLLPDAVRITPLGRMLRSSSLDELPQLWNVLRGDMSLVGPRPLPVAYLERYDSVQMRRHDVKPGLTGLAQVLGRNRLGWDERFRLDVWYVDHRSLLLELGIIAKTFEKLLKRDGISHPGSATMSEFRGNSGLESAS